MEDNINIIHAAEAFDEFIFIEAKGTFSMCYAGSENQGPILVFRKSSVEAIAAVQKYITKSGDMKAVGEEAYHELFPDQGSIGDDFIEEMKRYRVGIFEITGDELRDMLIAVSGDRRVRSVVPNFLQEN